MNVLLSILSSFMMNWVAREVNSVDNVKINYGSMTEKATEFWEKITNTISFRNNNSNTSMLRICISAWEDGLVFRRPRNKIVTKKAIIPWSRLMSISESSQSTLTYGALKVTWGAYITIHTCWKPYAMLSRCSTELPRKYIRGPARLVIGTSWSWEISVRHRAIDYVTRMISSTHKNRYMHCHILFEN